MFEWTFFTLFERCQICVIVEDLMSNCYLTVMILTMLLSPVYIVSGFLVSVLSFLLQCLANVFGLLRINIFCDTFFYYPLSAVYRKYIPEFLLHQGPRGGVL